MTPSEKAQVDDLIRRQSLFYLYRVFNGGLNRAHLEALQDPLIRQLQYLVDSAARQWSGNLMTLRAALVCMGNLWPHLLRLSGKDKDEHVEFPMEFSEQEVRETMENEPVWCKLNTVVDRGEERVFES